MPVSTSWIHGAYVKKTEAALHIQERKLVLAGGSSVHFGISAESITKALKIQTINYGVMALLDMDYTLYRLKRILKPGDMVILPLEYYHYGFSHAAPYSEQKKYYILTCDHDYFYAEVPFLQKVRLLYSINPLLFLSAFFEKIKSQNNLAEGGQYKEPSE